MNNRGIELSDWLLTESLRRHEQRLGRRGDDAKAMILAREAATSLDRRLAVRAQALPGLEGFGRDLGRLYQNGRRFLLALALLGLVGGWFAARASAADRAMDLLLVSLALVGLPTLILLIWLLVWIGSARSASTPGALSATVGRLLAWLGPRLLSGTLAAELAQSAVSWLGTAAGRWWLSLGSHLLWLGYSLGALLGLAFFFSVAQYDLSWGTTILSDESVADLIVALAWLPEQLAMVPAMTPDIIERGREGGLAGLDRALWARFLMVLVVLYVILPRLFLVLLSWWRFRRLSKRVPLDLALPGYLRLRAELMPSSSEEKLLGDRPEDDAYPEQRPRPASSSRPIVVGFELDGDADQALARALDDRVVHLGCADRRQERESLVQALSAIRPPPSDLLVVCSLLRTPDSGSARLIGRLADAARGALTLLAIDADQVSARGGDLAGRLADWERLARRAGGRLEAIDLGDDPAALRARVDALLSLPAAKS